MPVTIGVVRETAPGETRVALVPEVARKLAAAGARLVIEAGSGLAAGFPDAAFEGVEVAANSDEFARATVMDYWKLLLGEPPTPEQSGEFEALWRSLRSDNYSIDALLHRLIDSEAYGVP